ncbi:phenylacetate-CoA oxygenase/reductase subunit PaaK [Streptomyces europaeiscabiei]|uniref:Phenylacetate-CoA oxygenase/reductase subunit PaaK n=1 Tax=Streptomyces europaeiscabiei TaxID=146819 RepID=A0AAJ2PMM1_9ACTN|nr:MULTISPECIES: 1,2-phenylacetyl-CoA epoxidase subunit PaaE [Streptomyces]KFF95028.1 phenylacetic acid degradation protein [Streptomyces scabiei]MDX3129801.1 phenylacetate-CoA oxygenase/reductase subunit PaaK [Streptomyces europaeiscabiei]
MTVPAVPSPARSRRRPAFHALRVAAVEPLCADAAALTLEVPDRLADAFAFRPGQCLTVRREIDGRDERRSYSICSPAGTAPRIGVRVVPGGLFSSWLVHGVRPGDILQVMAPAGAFSPDLTSPGGPAHHVLVAAGSGITPMVSIAASVLAADEGARVTLLYGNRRTGTVMFADDIADLKDRYPDRFQLAHVLSREPREAELLSGRLDTERLTALLDALLDVRDVAHWWLCGPHGMVRDAHALLTRLGVPADRVHQELFHADEEPPATPPTDRDDTTDRGPTSEITVILDGRATTFTVPRHRSVLDSAQQARPDMPFACKGGVCGTCRALVTDGAADMRRNYALEPAEVAAGYVLTCQTYTGSDTLTIDFDS